MTLDDWITREPQTGCGIDCECCRPEPCESCGEMLTPKEYEQHLVECCGGPVCQCDCAGRPRPCGLCGDIHR